MEGYILTTVNRGTGEERCNQAAHQLQGLHPVTFNSHSDRTICSAWYAHAIPIAAAVAISTPSSSRSSSSVSFLITTEHFHTSLVLHMKQITAKALSTFLPSLRMVGLEQGWDDWQVSFAFRVSCLALIQGEIGFKIANLASPPAFGLSLGNV